LVRDPFCHGILAGVDTGELYVNGFQQIYRMHLEAEAERRRRDRVLLGAGYVTWGLLVITWNRRSKRVRFRDDRSGDR
jgi:hypothetical protein